MPRLTPARLGVATLLVLAGCKNEGPTLGTISIDIVTTGGDVDLNGYVILLDGTTYAADVNGVQELPAVPTGTHTVELGDVAANCAVDRTTTQSVTVRAGQTTEVDFAVACLATGVEITVATLGIDLDPDGYGVSVDAAPRAVLATNGAVAITRITPGVHTVSLTGIAANCASGVPNPFSLDIVAKTVASVAFPIECRATSGIIEVTAATTGMDLDLDGYTIRVDSGAPQHVAANGRIRFSVGAGDHHVTLGDAATNCTASGDNPRMVSVATGGLTRDTARTMFQVSCVAVTGVVEVRVATSGAQLDPDGYLVGLDQSCQYDYYYGWSCTYLRTGALNVNGTLRFATVPVGEHDVTLESIAPNCRVAGGNPRILSVSSGDTARADFAVTCAVTGTLQVTVATSGTDVDPDGYRLTLASVHDSYVAVTEVNQTTTFTGLFPGDYQLAIGGVASNCTVAGSTSDSVTVPAGGIVSAAFTVTCVTAGQLAVVLPTTGNNEIYTIKANGTDATRLTTNQAADAEPAWSPSGAIAFSTARDGNFEIYMIDADGLNPVRLTFTESADRSPAWSPDGSKIAFTSMRDGNAEIYVMDGQIQERLTNTSAAESDPAWSPDGTRIAFASLRDGNWEIYVMNADGQNPIRLTTNAVDDLQPDWSPDGTKLVFSRLTGCDLSNFCDYDLFVMNADGSGATQLTHETSDVDPAWSPDGSWIAFTATVCNGYGWNYECDSTRGTVRIIRTDGSNVSDVMSGAFQPAWRR